MLGMATVEMDGNKRVTAHIGLVAVVQVAVAVITVAVTFGLMQGDIQSLKSYRESQEVHQRQFEVEYNRSNGELVKAVTRLDTTVSMLVEEVRELRKRRIQR